MMKKMLLKTAALALMLCAAAFGEAAAPDQSVIDRFCDTWVDGGAAVEIWYDEGAFHCSATQTDDDGAHTMAWTYETCRYDADSNSLICEGGTRSYEYFDEASQTPVSDRIIENLTDSFSFDDQGRLIWNDQEGVCKRYMLARLEDAAASADDEARAFAGRWGNGRCTIDIEPQSDDSFQVRIVWGSSAAQQAEWRYACAYDHIKKQLYSYEPGTKAVVTYAENGEVADRATEYEDGQATFTLDGAGMLIWNDAKENAAEGLRFERGIDVSKSEPKTIAPQFDGLNTTDATCPAAFDRDDLKDGVLNNVRIFSEDDYDILDVAQMAVGDTFVAEGKSVTIASLETDEAGNININGGMDAAGGYTLTNPEDTNGWTTLIEDDFCTYTERGAVSLPLAENVKLTDGWDIEKPPVTAAGIDDVTKAIMASENDSFTEHSTELVIEGGKVVEINRRYVP